MDKWILTIEKVQNGFVLTGKGAENNGPFVIREDEMDELKVFEELTWQIWEYFGYYGSKHDPERLRITREKQK
jgi:hypothetical protein